TINLNDYIGENIKFRFHLVSDSYTTADGFYFDELTVQKLQNTSASINENTNEAILIYPNPSSDYVTIKCNLEEKFSIFLTDISGKHIINKKEFIDNKVLNIKNLNKGIYFITITTKNNIKTFKLIKK
ncbi:MAG TPA: T9SS type A sorting domain-containing protein, partial [Flavobacteriia bacterium]|nr:T9SS type A sorting domain-containing protein [Flavobacteriia bacterium]